MCNSCVLAGLNFKQHCFTWPEFYPPLLLHVCDSMDAYHSMAKQEEKVKKLAERRVKLRSLLQQEANDLQVIIHMCM